MLELTQARTRARLKNGKFKHSSLHSWRQRKKSLADYFPYVLAVISIWSVVFTSDLAPLAEEWYGMTGRIVISRESSQARHQGTDASEGHGEPVSADSLNDGAPREVVMTHSEPRPTLSGDSITEKIKLAWMGTGDEEKMVDIIKCESRFNSDTIGDLGIQFEKDGKLWGRSVGLAQVRILPGRTDNPKEYEKQLKDVDFNLKEGRGIYDRQGLGAWMNCAKRVGAI